MTNVARFEDYLLRNSRDEAVFLRKYAERVAMYKEKYLEWYEANFQTYVWRRMQVRRDSAEFVIGILCHLHLEGRIQFSIRFPADGSIELQREEVAEKK